ncbi:MAG: aminoacyl-tRNA hydrolase [Alphaproteobacteria bacterium]
MLGFSKKQKADIWLFVGLGNPGVKYAGNRHNIGFMVADRIADDFGFPGWRAKFQGRFAEGNLDGKKVILLKPETYMNNSGQSATAAAKFYKIAPDRIFVFHDEIDLAPGKIRVKKGGGNAGHNGLRSIQDHLGTPDFWRVRLGVGRPVHGEVHDYVLSDFAKQDKEGLDLFLASTSKYCGLLLEGRDSEFMTRVAEDTKKE